MSEKDPAAVAGDGANTLSPMLLAVLANRFDGVVREMTNTMLRTGRSAVINSARDFSCGITTADNQLFATAEGLPPTWSKLPTWTSVATS